MSLGTGSRPTVLVADDDELVRFSLRLALEADGCLVVEAQSGEGAATVADSQDLDVIFLDAHMPGWTLMETLDALRVSLDRSKAAVVMLSGADVDLGLHESLVFSILRKPVSLMMLRTTMHAIAERDDVAHSTMS